MSDERKKPGTSDHTLPADPMPPPARLRRDAPPVEEGIALGGVAATVFIVAVVAFVFGAGVLVGWLLAG